MGRIYGSSVTVIVCTTVTLITFWDLPMRGIYFDWSHAQLDVVKSKLLAIFNAASYCNPYAYEEAIESISISLMETVTLDGMPWKLFLVLRCLLKHEWYNRVWVIQESILARSADIALGPGKVSLPTLAVLCQALRAIEAKRCMDGQVFGERLHYSILSNSEDLKQWLRDPDGYLDLRMRQEAFGRAFAIHESGAPPSRTIAREELGITAIKRVSRLCGFWLQWHQRQLEAEPYEDLLSALCPGATTSDVRDHAYGYLGLILDPRLLGFRQDYTVESSSVAYTLLVSHIIARTGRLHVLDLTIEVPVILDPMKTIFSGEMAGSMSAP